LAGLADLIVIDSPSLAVTGGFGRARRSDLGRVRGDTLVVGLEATGNRLGRQFRLLADVRARVKRLLPLAHAAVAIFAA
jgi:hypothetical protein